MILFSSSMHLLLASTGMFFSINPWGTIACKPSDARRTILMKCGVSATTLCRL